MADINDITTGALNGTGYFDKFMEALDLHIDREAARGRLKGPEFATVYLGALQLALQQAVQYVSVVEQVRASSVRSAAEVALLDQKKLTEEAQILDSIGDPAISVAGAIGKQKSLQQAQIDGFSRDAEQKALKILMDAWSVSKSVSGDVILPPDGAQNDDIEDMIIKLRQGIGITTSIYKFTANAGPDQTVTVNNTVQLDGTGSTSPSIDVAGGEKIASQTWIFLQNPDNAVLSDPNSLTPTFPVGATPQTYRLSLKIIGDQGSSSIDEVAISTVA